MLLRVRSWLDYLQRHPVNALQYRIAYRVSRSGVLDVVRYPCVNAKYSAVAYRPPTLLLACVWREKRREEENIEKKKK
jgi:hypothetical protein